MDVRRFWMAAVLMAALGSSGAALGEGEIIERIVVDGNVRISAQALLSQIDIKEGASYDEEALRAPGLARLQFVGVIAPSRVADAGLDVFLVGGLAQHAVGFAGGWPAGHPHPFCRRPTCSKPFATRSGCPTCAASC